jgi:2-polyprenyl-3-methyl-5-hydroxy-6-metoxy-1,4-benzoquinol methylase
MKTPDITAVIPVYCNEQTLGELYRQLKETFCKENLSYQIVFVDDASPDGSSFVLSQLAKADAEVTLLSLKQNSGQHRAVLKGLEISKGSVVVVLDADLQDSPFFIPQLMHQLKRGYEAVFAGRRGHYESFPRLVTSKIFKTLLHAICRVPKDAGMFVIMSRKMVTAVLKIEMPSPFVVAMIGLTQLPVCSLPCERHKRFDGKSSYTSWMRLKIGLGTILQVLRLKPKLHHGESQKQYYAKGDHANIFPENYPTYIQRHLEEALKYLPNPSGLRILEVGCGMGRFTIPLAQKNIPMEGLDISEVLLEKLHTYAKSSSIPTYSADLLDPPEILKNQYDAVVGFFILHHLPDMEKAFKAISSLLKPGGKAVFVEPNPYNPLFYLQILFHPKMRWKNERFMLLMRPRPLAQALQKSRLDGFTFHRFGFFPPFLSHLKIQQKLEKIPFLKPILPFQVFYFEKARI